MFVHVFKRVHHTPIRPATFSKCRKKFPCSGTYKNFFCLAKALRLTYGLSNFAIERVRRRALTRGGARVQKNYLKLYPRSRASLNACGIRHSLLARTCSQ